MHFFVILSCSKESVSLFSSFCAEHSKKALTIRQKASRKRKPQETPESILEELEHYGTKAITNEQGNEIRRHRPSVDSVANRILGKGVFKIS